MHTKMGQLLLQVLFIVDPNFTISLTPEFHFSDPLPRGLTLPATQKMATSRPKAITTRHPRRKRSRSVATLLSKGKRSQHRQFK